MTTALASEICVFTGSHRYATPREHPISIYLVLSLVLLASCTLLVGRYRPRQEQINTLTVDLAPIDGVENEPPPLGEPQSQDEPPAPTQQEPPEAAPDPVIQEPPPPAVAEFAKPAELPRPETERPEKHVPKPRIAQHSAPAPAPARAAAPPPRGSPTGVSGGHGGSRGDFIATPYPAYDSVALQRHYQGSGEVLIVYSGGSITSVEMIRGTGVSYLDSKTTSWVRNHYRLKPGVSGKVKFSITWVLPQ